MAIELWEHVESPEVTKTNSDGSADTKWIVRGAGDQASAMSTVLLATPLFVSLQGQLLIRQDVSVVPIGANNYKASVKYGSEADPDSQKPLDPLEWKYTFDTTGGSHRIVQAEEEVRRYETWVTGYTAPDLGGALNFDGKQCHPIDIVIPKLEFTITVAYAPQYLTIGVVQEFARKTGRTNSDAWLGFDPGELLFLGAVGDGVIPTVYGQRVKPVQVQLKFAASENRTDIQIGIAKAIKKEGWEYLWVRYQRFENGGFDKPVAVHAYVDRVYRSLAFKPFFKFG